MKYIKSFEIVNQDKPKIGDYAIINIPEIDADGPNKGKHFINNNVGKIIKTTGYDNKFLIKYNINFNTCGFTKAHFQFLEDPNGQRYINKEYITHWSDNKEELENILNSNKFNL
jgi:hypothetical protein